MRIQEIKKNIRESKKLLSQIRKDISILKRSEKKKSCLEILKYVSVSVLLEEYNDLLARIGDYEKEKKKRK